MPKNNYPTAVINNLPDDYVRETTNSIQELASQGKITGAPEDDDAFEERITQTIDFCKRKGLRVGIETVCASLGISRQCLLDWQKNKHGNVSERRQEDIVRLKQLIYAFLEQAGMSGKVHPTTYIWLSKNWMRYTDNLPVDTDADRQDRPTQSADEIASKYAEVLEMPEEEKPKL